MEYALALVLCYHLLPHGCPDLLEPVSFLKRNLAQRVSFAVQFALKSLDESELDPDKPGDDFLCDLPGLHLEKSVPACFVRYFLLLSQVPLLP